MRTLPIAFTVTVLAAAICAAQGGQDGVRQLRPGATISRDLGGGDTQTYAAALHAGDFLDVVVEPMDIGVGLALISATPGGRLDSPSAPGVESTKWIAFHASVEGSVTLEVHAFDGQSPGRYTIAVEELRAFRPDDDARLAAQDVAAEAMHLSLGSSDASSRDAVAKYDQAAAMYRKAGRLREEAAMWAAAARVFNNLSERDHALERHGQALEIYQAAKDDAGVGRVLDAMAMDCYMANRYDEAVRHASEALIALRRAGLRRGEAGALDHRSAAAAAERQYAAAIPDEEQAIRIWRELRDRPAEARALDNLAFAYFMTDANDQAIARYAEALAIHRELKDRESEAHSLRRMGQATAGRRQPDAAIALYQQALAIYRELRDRADEAAVLVDLGGLSSSSNDADARRQYLQQAIAIYVELNDRAGQARALDELGMAAYLAFRHAEAIGWYQQALSIKRQLNDRQGQAFTLGFLGLSQRRMHQTDAAVATFQDLLTLRRDQHDQPGEADALNDIGFTLYLGDRYPEAVEWYLRELELRRALGDRAHEASALSSLADAEDRLKQYDQAIEYLDQALGVRQSLKDEAGEATVLNSLGREHIRLKQYRQGSELYERALTIQRKLKDRVGQARTFESLGSAYSDLREQRTAIGYYEQARALWHDLTYETSEASALWNLALLHERLHESDTAINLYQQDLALQRKTGNRSDEALALNGLARVYALTDGETATKYLEQELAIQRDLADIRAQVSTYSMLGVMQAKLSHYDKELDYYAQALTTARAAKYAPGEAFVLLARGSAYMRLHQLRTAIADFDQGLAIARAADDSTMVCRMLAVEAFAHELLQDHATALTDAETAASLAHSIGDSWEVQALTAEALIHFRLNQPDQTGDIIDRVLTLARAGGNRIDLANAFYLQGVRYYNLKQLDRSADAFEQALTVAHELQLRENEATILGDLMRVWADRQQPRLAIIFGKKSVNIIQAIRHELPDLDQTLQQAFVQGKESGYRTLANLLAGEGRLAEAQQVLGLLKSDEFSSFVQRDRTVSSDGAALAMTSMEAGWERRYVEIAGRLTALGERRGLLLSKPERTSAEDRELSTLDADLETGGRAFQAFLGSLSTATGPSSGGERLARIEEAQGLMETLHDLGPGTVAVYTIAGANELRMILVTSAVQKGYVSPISAADLNRKILAFRDVVRNPSADPRPLARELYDLLVRPMADDLEGAKATTIMWSLDGGLRYVPMAALFDGSHYLVERYRNVVFTPASQSRLKDPVSRDWRGLAVGVSLAHEGFQALPNVPGELNGIIRADASSAQGVLAGTVELDAAFTKDGFRAELRNHYSVVHIASHFDFEPGTDRNSFLLLGDGGRLTLEEFRSFPQLLQGVELLTLSACDTAVGGEDADGREVEGFAVLAQRQGAKAVIATLWAVADASTATLMKEFYSRRTADPTMTKAEALRQAQLALLQGTARGAASDARGVNLEPAGTGAFVTDPDRPYAHPYYWAPFLLMGNWK